jgi:hypothetical protein
MFRTFVSIAAAALGLASAYTPQALKDKITNLPGSEGLDIKFNQFSGYIDINGTATKRLHYWLVESQNNPVSTNTFIALYS